MSENERIFNQIVRDYSERLWWHVRRFVNSHEDADDLLQEIFLKVWAALPSFRGESQLFTWVWRIATNETLNHLRKEKVRAALRLTLTDFSRGYGYLRCPLVRRLAVLSGLE